MEFKPGASFHAHLELIKKATDEAGGGELGLQLALNQWVGLAREAGFSEEFKQYVVQTAHAQAT